MIIFEIIFVVNIGLTFFVDFDSEGDGFGKAVREFDKIAKRYANGYFFVDVLTVIPFYRIVDHPHSYGLQIIKVVRVVRGLELLNVMAMMQKIKDYYKSQLLKITNEQKNNANYNEKGMTMVDNNKIDQLILIGFWLGMVRLVLIIINFSYFIGMFFYLYCFFTREYFPENTGDSNFIDYYSLSDKEDSYITVISVYYSFTTLSTVGFGDYAPRSNKERLLISFNFIFGVAIFSYMMGNFIEMVDKYKRLSADTDCADELSKFFGLIQKFNNNVPVKKDL